MRIIHMVLPAIVAVAASAQTRPVPGVFAESDEIPHGHVNVSVLDAPSAVRRRSALIDLDQLAATRAHVGQPGASVIRFNLFDGVESDGIVERVRATSAGYALSGRLGEPGTGGFTIVVNGDVVAGDVRGPDGVYRLLGRGGTVQIEQLDASLLSGCEGELVPSLKPTPLPRQSWTAPPSPVRGAEAARVAEDDGSVIDVFVFYTVTNRRLAGGHDLIRAIVDLYAAWTNEAYALSGVRQRVNLVGVAESEDLPRENQLNYFRSKMPDVREIRDAYAADLMALMNLKAAGSAFLSTLESDDETFGFSQFGLYSPRSFAHELGHNMGLRHPRNGLNPDRENTPYPYSHGYVLPGLPRYDRVSRLGNFTIMDGGGGAGLQRFSSPLLQHKGIPLGVPGDEPSFREDGPADAVRSLDNTRLHVANFRSSAGRCHFGLAPEAASVPAAGGSFTVDVETGDDCSWSVRSIDPVVALESDADGRGNGRVTYTVTANEGWARTSAMRIAGEMFLVRQASDRVPTPVCERSPVVRDAIAEALQKPCEDIDAADLNRIASLKLESETVPAEGDFDGMTNLGELRIEWSEDALLPASIFDGLVNVVELALTGAGLEAGAPDALQNLTTLRLIGGDALPSALFGSLSNLERLLIDDYDISSLPLGTFRGLTNLKFLSLHRSRIGPIERGSFDGLGELTELEIARSEIQSLGSGAFRGLPNLRMLHLYENDLTRLAAGTFDGLSRVEWLNVQFNELSELDRESFRGLSSITTLLLDYNRLETLPGGVFDELTTLKWQLELSNNRLESLQPGTFDQLRNLRILRLGQNNLVDLAPATFDGLIGLRVLDLHSNDLVDLAPATFDGLTSLEILDLHSNDLHELGAGAFEGLPHLAEIWLHENNLSRLHAGVFLGLSQLKAVTLRDNPGAPFPFVLKLDRAPRSERGIESVALRVDQGAPFPMTVGLLVQDSNAGVAEASILAGQTQGDGLAVPSLGDSVVKVSVASVPDDPTVDGCEVANARSLRSYRGYQLPCYPGVKLVAGEPILLYGVPDQTLADERSATVDLRDVFGVFFDSDQLSFTARSSDPGVVEPVVANGALTLTPGNGTGTATVTLVATDGQTTVTRHFTVTVPETLRSFWRGWRLRLLLPQSDDD